MFKPNFVHISKVGTNRGAAGLQSGLISAFVLMWFLERRKNMLAQRFPRDILRNTHPGNECLLLYNLNKTVEGEPSSCSIYAQLSLFHPKPWAVWHCCSPFISSPRHGGNPEERDQQVSVAQQSNVCEAEINYNRLIYYPNGGGCLNFKH